MLDSGSMCGLQVKAIDKAGCDWIHVDVMVSRSGPFFVVLRIMFTGWVASVMPYLTLVLMALMFYRAGRPLRAEHHHRPPGGRGAAASDRPASRRPPSESTAPHLTLRLPHAAKFSATSRASIEACWLGEAAQKQR